MSDIHSNMPALKEVLNKIKELKSLGFITNEPDNLLNKAETEYNNQNYKNAYDLATQSIEKSKEIKEYGIKSKNQIKQTKNNITFAKSNNINTTEAENLLNKAKTEFNKGNYKNAYDLATQSKNKIETQIDNLINLANSKINELQNLINKLNSQNIDTEELKTSLTNAKTKFNNKEYHLSLTTANQSVALANQILTAKQAIDNAKKLINQEKSKGNDVSDAEDLLNNAEIEFQNKNYKKYWRLLKNIAKEFAISCKYTI